MRKLHPKRRIRFRQNLKDSSSPQPITLQARWKNPKAESWFADELDLDNNGNIKSNIHNVAAIVFNDPRFYDAIWWDEFGYVARLFHPIKSKTDNVPDILIQDPEHGDRWEDIMHITVRAILATPNGAGRVGYGIGTVADRDIKASVALAANRRRYHPVKQEIEKEVWDGITRVERLFIDYLGCPDTPYYREAARKVLIASVARVFEPGCKFDFAPILQGRQGIRKSSFVQALYGTRFFGELNCDLSNVQKIAETITGRWAVELPELTSLTKSDHNDAKQFMSTQEDVVRLAYRNEVSVLPRRCVVWGTTNDITFLKDQTGNRRWWVIPVLVEIIDTDRLEANRYQLWAEAFVLYQEMRKTKPRGNLPLYLESPEAIQESTELQEGARELTMQEVWIERITEWVDTPVTLQTFATSRGVLPASLHRTADPSKTWVIPTIIGTAEVGELALSIGGTMLNQQHPMNLGRSLNHLPGWERVKGRVRMFGSTPRNLWQRTDCSKAERNLGFRIVEGPDQPGFDVSDNLDDKDIL